MNQDVAVKLAQRIADRADVEFVYDNDLGEVYEVAVTLLYDRGDAAVGWPSGYVPDQVVARMIHPAETPWVLTDDDDILEWVEGQEYAPA